MTLIGGGGGVGELGFDCSGQEGRITLNHWLRIRVYKKYGFLR